MGADPKIKCQMHSWTFSDKYVKLVITHSIDFNTNIRKMCLNSPQIFFLVGSWIDPTDWEEQWEFCRNFTISWFLYYFKKKKQKEKRHNWAVSQQKNRRINFILIAQLVTFCLTMPFYLSLHLFSRTCRTCCSPDGESTKSGSSKTTQAPFLPCYKSHLYGVTCSDWSISTYLHTAI